MTVRAKRMLRPYRNHHNHNPPRVPTARGQGPWRPWSLAAMVQSFKSVSARRINASRGTPGAPVWQRNYYERVVRNDDELDRIRQYIADNPAQWAMDRENPMAGAQMSGRIAIRPYDASWPCGGDSESAQAGEE